MNSRILSIGVFMVLMLSSLLAGRQGYFGAKEAITADLNQALMRTLEERQDNIVAQDSIRAYKQLREASDGPVWLAIADRRLCRHLKNERLKGKTFLSFEVIDAAHPKKAQPADALCSDTLIINKRALQRHANHQQPGYGHDPCREKLRAPFRNRRIPHVRPTLVVPLGFCRIPLGDRFPACCPQEANSGRRAATLRWAFLFGGRTLFLRCTPCSGTPHSDATSVLADAVASPLSFGIERRAVRRLVAEERRCQ